MNICIIEDDPATRMLLRALVNSGQTVKSTVMEAISGEDALAKLAAEGAPAIDVYLVDLDLPGMSGLEVIAHLRTHYGRGTEYSPYIMMVTAHEPGEALGPALEAGANDYLTKPVNAKVLQTRLKVAQRLLDQAGIHAQSDYAKALVAYTAGQMTCPLAVVELNDPSQMLKVTFANVPLVKACPDIYHASLSGRMEWNPGLAEAVLEHLRAGRGYQGPLACKHPDFMSTAHTLRAYPTGPGPFEHAMIILDPTP